MSRFFTLLMAVGLVATSSVAAPTAQRSLPVPNKVVAADASSFGKAKLKDARFATPKSGNALGMHRAASRAAADDAVVYINEDFSKLTNGSDGAPYMTVPLVDVYAYEAGDKNALKVPTDKTNQPGWSGGLLYEAGGSMYVGYDENYGGGWLNTPKLAYFSSTGIITVSFRARSESPYGDYLVILDADQNSEAQVEVEISGEWEEYTVMLEGEGSGLTNLQFWTMIEEPFYIDDIVINDQGLHAPVIYDADDFDGTSFTAKWDAVPDADLYYLTVYSVVNEDGEFFRDEAVVDRQEVEGTSFHVSGLEPADGYVYFVTAKVGTVLTNASRLAVAQIAHLDAPELLGFSNVTDDSFVGSWTSVDNAQAYYVDALIKHVAKEDGEKFYYFNNDFSSVTPIMVAENDYIAGFFDEYGIDHHTGWGVSFGSLREGKVCIDNTLVGEYDSAYMISAPIQLPENGGSIDITANCYMTGGSGQIEFALYAMTENGFSYLDYPKSYSAQNSSTRPTEYTATLRGYGEVYLLIMPDYMIDRVWFDDLKVSRTLSAGEEVIVGVTGGGIAEAGETSLEIARCPMVEGDVFGYAVTPVAENLFGDVVAGKTVTMFYGDAEGGIADAATSAAAIEVLDGNLVVNGAAGADVAVYTAAGALVALNSHVDSCTIALPTSGIYIVKVGNTVKKVVK